MWFKSAEAWPRENTIRHVGRKLIYLVSTPKVVSQIIQTCVSVAAQIEPLPYSLSDRAVVLTS